MSNIFIQNGSEFEPYDPTIHTDVNERLITFAAEITDQFKFMPSELQFRISVESEFTQVINVRLTLTGGLWTNRVYHLSTIQNWVSDKPLAFEVVHTLLSEAAPREYLTGV